jgi:hypothetical protein
MLGKLINVTEKVKAKQAHDLLLKKSMELEKARGAVAADFSGVGAPVVSRAGAGAAPKVVAATPKPKAPSVAPVAPATVTPESTAARVKTMWDEHFPEEPGKGEAFSRQLLEHMTAGRHDDAIKMVTDMTSHMAHRTAHKAAMDHINAGRFEEAKQVLETHRSKFGRPAPVISESLSSTPTDKHPAAAPGVADPNPSIPPPPPAAAQPSTFAKVKEWMQRKMAGGSAPAAPAVATVSPSPQATFTEQAPKPSFAPQSPTLARPTTMSPDLVAKLSSWQAQRQAAPQQAQQQPAPQAAAAPSEPTAAPATKRRVVVPTPKRPAPAQQPSSQQLEQQVRNEGGQTGTVSQADLDEITGDPFANVGVRPPSAKRPGRPRRTEPAVDAAQAKANQEQGAEQSADRQAQVEALRAQQQARKWKPEYGVPKAKWDKMTSAQIDEFLANRAKPQ